MSINSRIAIGLDLGTSNSALARCEVSGEVNSLSIEQTVSSDAIGFQSVLPSVLFLPAPENQVAKVAGNDSSWVAGSWAREQASLVPGRAIISSKSWLCNSLVDRRAPILPWTADEGVAKLSPVTAATEILQHLRNELLKNGDNLPPVVLTVPASFEEAARTMTYEAAVAAGFSEVTLLEEPIAALYAWLDEHKDDWRKHLQPGDIILVCDVGGGTSDFSLIAVTDEEGRAAFRRLSVGEHILLGGDNMDLALAHTLRQRMEDGGTSVDQFQFFSLTQGARAAKEALLSNTDRSTYSIATASRGGNLFRSAATVEVTKEEVSELILEGFLPIVAFDEPVRMRRASALKDFGLPYAFDPAITRHLGAFLRGSAGNLVQSSEHAALVVNEKILPTKILFNGGVFASASFRDRILQQLEVWNGSKPGVLETDAVEGAVARGAAYYGGVVSCGSGLKIRAGLSRSYYVGIEPVELAVPGMILKTKGLCVAPQGLEEGTECELPGKEFILATGEAVEFRVFSANDRASDLPGTLIPDAEAALREGSPIRGTIEAPETSVPVTIGSRITEVGTLELSLKDVRTDRRWKLEFDVRSDLA